MEMMARELRGAKQDCYRGVGSGLLSVTIPYNMDFGLGAGVYWSDVPFGFPAICILIFLATRRVTPLLLAAVGLIASGINEVLLWRIHDEGRPDSSCLDGRAFPSGHSAFSWAVMWFVIWETIIRLYWSWPRKLWIIFIDVSVFLPVGFLRIHVGDHTWRQVGAGWVWGFVWSIIAFIIVHIILLFIWEPLQCTRFFRWALQNDFDPKFKYSIWRGKLYKKHVPEEHTYRDWRMWEHPFALAYYAALILSLVIFAIWGIVVGPTQKHREPNCDRASWATASGCGVLSFISALLFFLFVIFAVLFKSKSLESFRERYLTQPESIKPKRDAASKYLFANELNPFAVIDLGYGAAFWWGLAFCWAIGGITTADSKDCPETNATLPYFIIWIAVEAILVAIAILSFWMYSLVRFIQRLHKWRKNRKGKRRGGGSEKPKHADTEMARLSPSVYQNQST